MDSSDRNGANCYTLGGTEQPRGEQQGEFDQSAYNEAEVVAETSPTERMYSGNDANPNFPVGGSVTFAHPAPNVHVPAPNFRYLNPNVQICPPSVNYRPPRYFCTPARIEYKAAQVTVKPPEIKYTPPQVSMKPAHIDYQQPKVKISAPVIEYKGAATLRQSNPSSTCATFAQGGEAEGQSIDYSAVQPGTFCDE